MYGIMTAVNMRTKSRKQKWAERREKVQRLAKRIEHGDYRIIHDRINAAADIARAEGREAKGISYHSVRFTLDPDHRLYSERVVEEAERLFKEREEII